jgi:GNAT superfamily N-acetyltransferase
LAWKRGVIDIQRAKLNSLKIVRYFPGITGKITTLHAVYYKKYWGLDHSFEAQVGREVSDFVMQFDDKRDGLWNAISKDDLAGCIAIAGDRDHTDEARLRWFIVDPKFQGQSIGKMLIMKTINFCKEVEYERIYLWTFKGLTHAQLIYEQNGFRLTEEHDVEQWGRALREQRFDLVLR